MSRTLVLGLALLAAAGCTTPEGRTEERRDFDMRAIIPAQARFDVAVLGPNDQLEIRVFREPDMSGKFRVAQEGTIEFPLIGTVTVAGKTTSEVEQIIAGKLRDGKFLAAPAVTVVLESANSQKVFILGQVAKPGVFPFEANMTIIQLVSLAGGFTQRASRNAATVIRIVEGKEVRIQVPVDDIAQGRAVNFQMLPGDIVNVPEGWL